MRAAGMDAGSAVIRWGNVNRSIVLSSAVFEPDDKRSYRMKPGVRSIWVIGLSLQENPGDVSGPGRRRRFASGERPPAAWSSRVGADHQLVGLPRAGA